MGTVKATEKALVLNDSFIGQCRAVKWTALIYRSTLNAPARPVLIKWTYGDLIIWRRFKVR